MHKRSVDRKCKVRWSWKLNKWRPKYVNGHNLEQVLNCYQLCDQMNGIYKNAPRIEY